MVGKSAIHKLIFKYYKTKLRMQNECITAKRADLGTQHSGFDVAGSTQQSASNPASLFFHQDGGSLEGHLLLSSSHAMGLCPLLTCQQRACDLFGSRSSVTTSYASDAAGNTDECDERDGECAFGDTGYCTVVFVNESGNCIGMSKVLAPPINEVPFFNGVVSTIEEDASILGLTVMSITHLDRNVGTYVLLTPRSALKCPDTFRVVVRPKVEKGTTGFGHTMTAESSGTEIAATAEGCSGFLRPPSCVASVEDANAGVSGPCTALHAIEGMAIPGGGLFRNATSKMRDLQQQKRVLCFQRRRKRRQLRALERDLVLLGEMEEQLRAALELEEKGLRIYLSAIAKQCTYAGLCARFTSPTAGGAKASQASQQESFATLAGRGADMSRYIQENKTWGEIDGLQRLVPGSLLQRGGVSGGGERRLLHDRAECSTSQSFAEGHCCCLAILEKKIAVDVNNSGRSASMEEKLHRGMCGDPKFQPQAAVCDLQLASESHQHDDRLVSSADWSPQTCKRGPTERVAEEGLSWGKAPVVDLQVHEPDGWDFCPCLTEPGDETTNVDSVRAYLRRRLASLNETLLHLQKSTSSIQPSTELQWSPDKNKKHMDKNIILGNIKCDWQQNTNIPFCTLVHGKNNFKRPQTISPTTSKNKTKHVSVLHTRGKKQQAITLKILKEIYKKSASEPPPKNEKKQSMHNKQNEDINHIAYIALNKNNLKTTQKRTQPSKAESIYIYNKNNKITTKQQTSIQQNTKVAKTDCTTKHTKTPSTYLTKKQRSMLIKAKKEPPPHQKNKKSKQHSNISNNDENNMQPLKRRKHEKNELGDAEPAPMHSAEEQPLKTELEELSEPGDAEQAPTHSAEEQPLKTEPEELSEPGDAEQAPTHSAEEQHLKTEPEELSEPGDAEQAPTHSAEEQPLKTELEELPEPGDVGFLHCNCCGKDVLDGNSSLVCHMNNLPLPPKRDLDYENDCDCESNFCLKVSCMESACYDELRCSSAMSACDRMSGEMSFVGGDVSRKRTGLFSSLGEGGRVVLVERSESSGASGRSMSAGLELPTARVGSHCICELSRCQDVPREGEVSHVSGGGLNRVSEAILSPLDHVVYDVALSGRKTVRDDSLSAPLPGATDAGKDAGGSAHGSTGVGRPVPVALAGRGVRRADRVSSHACVQPTLTLTPTPPLRYGQSKFVRVQRQYDMCHGAHGVASDHADFAPRKLLHPRPPSLSAAEVPPGALASRQKDHDPYCSRDRCPRQQIPRPPQRIRERNLRFGDVRYLVQHRISEIVAEAGRARSPSRFMSPHYTHTVLPHIHTNSAHRDSSQFLHRQRGSSVHSLVGPYTRAPLTYTSAVGAQWRSTSNVPSARPPLRYISGTSRVGHVVGGQ